MSDSEASSIEPENPPVIFYRAEVRYRGRKTVMHLLVYLGLAVGAGSWCAVQFRHGLTDALFDQCVALVSIVAWVFVAVLFWKMLINSVLIAQIDEEGVRIGETHWDWPSIRKLGVIYPVIFGADFVLVLYANKSSAAGRLIPCGRAFGEEDYRAFLASIRPFLQRAYPHVDVPTFRRI